jgi:hypothetical protein
VELPIEDGVENSGGNCGAADDGDSGGGCPESLLDLLKLRLSLEGFDSRDFLLPLGSEK